ncbi:MAG: hypothetical protein KA746_15205 [Pyrinomonadaceae bacterium]|nr:hypothetical protein [Pyrinomonadaceae bacterium]
MPVSQSGDGYASPSVAPKPQGARESGRQSFPNDSLLNRETTPKKRKRGERPLNLSI